VKYNMIHNMIGVCQPLKLRSIIYGGDS